MVAQPSIRIVRPTHEQLHEVASLRWHWAVGAGHDAEVGQDTFVADFLRWMNAYEDSHHCLVALGPDDEVMGFGFLALGPRVPAPQAAERVSADVQAVFVRPEQRSRGVGGKLIEALVELARSHEAEHVTVHSSAAAVPSYRRAGFTEDPLMLNLMLI
jgi:GNAT superfamily N-acetyltransferase